MATEKKPALKGAAIDASILAGLGLITYGAWLVYQPAGFLAPGVVLLAVGLYAAVRR